jgi:hypothetical protein
MRFSSKVITITWIVKISMLFSRCIKGVEPNLTEIFLPRSRPSVPIDDQTWLTGIIKASDWVMFQQSPSLELPSQSIANMIWNILAKYFDVDGPRHSS